MSLDFTKVNYVDGSTIIEADNLNDIQDAILALDSNKVEAESGKGLSTEDYTSAEKSKLSGIQAGAQVNPGNATTSVSGLMSSVDKIKLDGIAAGATAVTIDSTLAITGQAADAKATGDAIGAKYTKPNGGIPKTDLESSVQVSLGKADTALQSSLKGEANGLAELDNSGKVPTSQLPSFVDDVLEYANLSEFPETGESGKIYVAIDTNKTYRWGGTNYIEISASLALGETSSTAYRGDRGAAAYTHAVTNKGSAFSNGLYKITTNTEGHVTSATSVTKNDLTSLGVYAKPNTGIPKTDLASDVQTSLGKADTAYVKPDTGIPKTDLASDVQTSLGKADTALQVGALPAGGTDGDVLVKNGATDYDAIWKKTPPQMGSLATIEPTSSASKAYAAGDYLVYNGQLYRVTTAFSSGQTLTPGGNIEATTVCGAFGRYQEYTLTKATEAVNWEILDSHACRCGNIAFIQVIALVQGAQDTNEVVMFRLPDALIPPYVVRARFATFDQKYDCNINIYNDSGEFRVTRLPSPQAGAIRINVSYPVINDF